MAQIYGIFGAGGFGREVMPILRAALAESPKPHYSEAVFVVDDAYMDKTPRTVDGTRVLSMSAFLRSDQERFFNVAVGSPAARQRIVERMPTEVKPFGISASSAVFYDANEIDVGSIFCGFTHVTSNAKIGKFFHCNIYSYVAHDCVIGDYVTFAPGVKCNGHVHIEDHAYIGTGAIIKDGTDKPIVIGRGAVVGMGAVVTKSVEPGATVVGNPARPFQRGS